MVPPVAKMTTLGRDLRGEIVSHGCDDLLVLTHAFDGEEYVTLRPGIEDSPRASEDVVFSRFSITGMALATPNRVLQSMDRAESRIFEGKPWYGLEDMSGLLGLRPPVRRQMCRYIAYICFAFVTWG